MFLSSVKYTVRYVESDIQLHDCLHCRIFGDESKVKDVLFCFVFYMQDLLQEIKQLKRKVEELEGQKGLYERKLRGTKVHIKHRPYIFRSNDG